LYTIEYLPKPLFDYFSRCYYDAAVGGSAPAIRCAYEVFGADQLVFATDAPWGPESGEFRLAEYPKTIESLGLPEQDKKKILTENTHRMFDSDYGRERFRLILRLFLLGVGYDY